MGFKLTETKTVFVIKNTETGKYFAGGYAGNSWGDEPREFENKAVITNLFQREKRLKKCCQVIQRNYRLINEEILDEYAT